jgi:hypothetical protein
MPYGLTIFPQVAHAAGQVVGWWQLSDGFVHLYRVMAD